MEKYKDAIQLACLIAMYFMGVLMGYIYAVGK